MGVECILSIILDLSGDPLSIPGSWPVLQPLFLPNTPSFEMLCSPSARSEADRGLSWPSAAERGAEAADNLARVLTRVASSGRTQLDQ